MNDAITESEFISAVGQYFREKRMKNGIRTNESPVFDSGTGNLLGGMGRPYSVGMDMKLKPGLRRSTNSAIVKKQ